MKLEIEDQIKFIETLLGDPAHVVDLEHLAAIRSSLQWCQHYKPEILEYFAAKRRAREEAEQLELEEIGKHAAVQAVKTEFPDAKIVSVKDMAAE
jgi:hypothetical protein